MDLFPEDTSDAPLAYRMRPRDLSELVGQEGLSADTGALGRMVQAGAVGSLILWGPPGSGKTTLAEILARASNAHIVTLSAVMAGVKEIRAAADQARGSRHATVLFLDEIHRLNKGQQDALLPHVESGLLTLIGATTENPSFEVNSALLSRAPVYVLEALGETALVALLRRALADNERGLGTWGIEADDETLQIIARAAGGDARRALSLLERAATHTRGGGDSSSLIDAPALEAVLGHRATRLDKQGDAYYDLLSALHKSIRSSRPDAALVYMARFVEGGGDPLDIARRLAAIASEDVGNTDPRALPLVMAAWDGYRRLGDAEGQRALAHAAIHLAVAPKSNAVDQAWKRARSLVAKEPDFSVPEYLRNAPTELMKGLGYGSGYRYAHREPQGYPAGAGHDCWPEGLARQPLFEPTQHGQEQRFAELMAWRQRLDDAYDEPSGER